jgi:hypothetical protein
MDYTLVAGEGDSLALGRDEKPLVETVQTGKFRNPVGEGATGAELQAGVDHLVDENNPHNLTLEPDETVEVVATATGFEITVAGAIKQGSIIFTSSNGANVVLTGAKAYNFIPYKGTLTSWEITADVAGSIELDVWKGTFADYPLSAVNSICAGNYPALIGVIKGQGDMTGWSSAAVEAGNYLQMNVRSVSNIRKLTLTLKVTKG